MAWGIQFHAELSMEGAEAFVAAFGDEAEAAGSPPSELLHHAGAAFGSMVPAQHALFHSFASLAED